MGGAVTEREARPWGARSDLPGEHHGNASHVRRVPLDGDYDPGGTYWGGGGQPLFLVWDDEDRVCYLRAADLDGAKAQFPHATWAPESGPTEGDLDDMTEAYLVAALFTGTDESDPSGGEPLDANYTTADIADETRAELRAIVDAFARENATTIAACVGKRGRHGKRECDLVPRRPLPLDGPRGHRVRLHGWRLAGGRWQSAGSGCAQRVMRRAVRGRRWETVRARMNKPGPRPSNCLKGKRQWQPQR